MTAPRRYYTLARRSPVEPMEPEEVDGILHVFDQQPVYEAETSIGQFGSDWTTFYRAFYNGKPAFLRRDVWEPAVHSSALGTLETILTFEEGNAQIEQYKKGETNGR